MFKVSSEGRAELKRMWVVVPGLYSSLTLVMASGYIVPKTNTKGERAGSFVEVFFNVLCTEIGCVCFLVLVDHLWGYIHFA
jgi:hypothetical protein